MFGEAGFLLPASLMLGLALWIGGERRTALAFAGGVALCAGAMILAKIAFMTRGPYGAHQIYSPSGHAALSAMFYVSLAYLAFAASGSNWGWLALGASAILVSLIAMSRLTLHAHSLRETALGLAVGLACFGVFWRFADRRLAVDLRKSALVIVAFGVFYCVAGRHIDVEGPLESVARRFSGLTRN